MSTRVTVYIPSHEEKSAYYIEQALHGFSSLAGGATVVESTGAWVMHDSSLCTESVSAVYTLADSAALPKVKNFVLRFTQEVKAGLSQEAVLVTLEPSVETVFI